MLLVLLRTVAPSPIAMQDRWVWNPYCLNIIWPDDRARGDQICWWRMAQAPPSVQDKSCPPYAATCCAKCCPHFPDRIPATTTPPGFNKRKREMEQQNDNEREESEGLRQWEKEGHPHQPTTWNSCFSWPHGWSDPESDSSKSYYSLLCVTYGLTRINKTTSCMQYRWTR